MDIRLSDEQEMLREMVRRFLADRVPAAQQGQGPIAEADWRGLGELGVLAAPLPGTAGGLGGAPQDAMIIAEALGETLAITPFAETMLAAADLVALYGDAARVERMVSGEGRVALAVGAVEVRADGLHGACPLVRWGEGAEAFMLVDGDKAWLVDAEAAGVSRRTIRIADGSAAVALTLDAVAAEPLAVPPGAVGTALAMAQLGYIAEMVGLMTVLRAQTADYVGQRQQFGAAIGTFQAVQHKLARMFVRHEQSRSMLLRAAMLRRDDPGLIRAVLAAKAYVAEAAQYVAEEAVQLHGGMGITDELPVGRALRRVLVLTRLFGRADEARAKLAA